jgi:hypothetical protein
MRPPSRRTFEVTDRGQVAELLYSCVDASRRPDLREPLLTGKSPIVNGRVSGPGPGAVIGPGQGQCEATRPW